MARLPYVFLRYFLSQAISALATVSAATLYSIGNPTAEEQLYVELINRARANPAAEAQRLKNITDPQIRDAYNYWKVNLEMMASQITPIASTPPLSINAQLTAAARAHSQDMLNRGFQSHTGSNGSSPESRIRAQGYNFQAWGENVFAYSKSVPYGHAAFEVDWGTGPGGMLSPPGHRNNIHQKLFREVGVGNIKGQNGVYGPQFVTQEFGTSTSLNVPFITGVVYRDLNNNSFYDIGEGVGGMTVNVTGSSYYAVTSSSGGYSVPVPGNGSYTVTFSGSGFASAQRSVTVSNLANVKVDHRPAAPTATMTVSLSRLVRVSKTQAYFDATIGNGTPTGVEVQRKSSVSTSWAKATDVSIQNLGSGKYRVSFNPSLNPLLFFRVVAY